MDSLLASYASSDDEESPPNPQPHKHTNQSSKFSLPPPKSTSSSPFTLPPPKSKQKQSDSDEHDHQLHPQKPSSLFSSIPQPKSDSSLFSSLPPAKIHLPDPKLSSASKKVVQFRPPVNFASMKSSNLDDDDDEEDEEEKERKRKKAELAAQTPSVRSFLSSIPAPRNSVTLGVLGSGLGTGRRSVIDADVQGEIPATEVGVSGSEGEVSMGGQTGSVEYASTADYTSWGTKDENAADVDGYSGYGGVDGNAQYSNSIAASGDYSSNDYVNYGDYGQYPNNWAEGSSAAAPEVPIDRALRLPAKRGRKDDPPQFIEVNQDELIKNRPREDQAKLTGIAFGPAYQPASSKGKPTKLHKRKHQIGALYFDMKQKETELAERRSKGFLTKAQTQGKYGW